MSTVGGGVTATEDEGQRASVSPNTANSGGHSAWSWGLGAGLGHATASAVSSHLAPASAGATGTTAIGSNMRKDAPMRYVSPFVSTHVLPHPPSEQEGQQEDDDELLAFRVPAPIETSHDLLAMPASSTDVSASGSATPRSARTPIGTKAGVAPVQRVASVPRDSSSSSSSDPYEAAFSKGGVTLTLQDDSGVEHALNATEQAMANVSLSQARFDAAQQSSKGVNGPDGMASVLNSPFSSTNLTSLAGSPLSTPNFPSQQHNASSGQISPHSPDYTFSRVPSTSSFAVRDNAEYEHPTDKALAGVFNSTSNSNSNQQQHHGASVHAYQQSSRVGSAQHSPQPFAQVGGGVAVGVEAAPAGGANGSGGDVAYVVLPNGQVQAIPMSALQQHLPLGAAGAGSAPGSAARTPSTAPVQGYTPQAHHQQPQHQSYSQYDAVPSDNDAFSLATLSTQTLPLYPAQQAAPSTQHHAHSNARAPSPYQAPVSHHQSQSSTPLLHSSRLPPPGPQYAPVPRRDSQLEHAHGHGHASPASNSLSPNNQAHLPPSQRNMSVEHARELVMQLSLQPPPSAQTHGHSHAHSYAQGGRVQAPYAPPPAQQSHHLQQVHPQTHHLHQQPSASRDSRIEHIVPSSHATTASNVSSPGFAPQYYPHSATGEGMVALAKSQAGSRLLQTKLAANDPVYYAQVFDEVYDALPELMVDLFGNYLCQKLLTFANDAQRLQILLKVLPELLEISCDRQGTRAIQKLIESLRHQSERQLVMEWLQMPLLPGQGTGPVGRTSDRYGQSPHLRHSTPPPAVLGGSPLSTPSPPSLGAAPLPLSPSCPPVYTGTPHTALQVGGFSHPLMPRLVHLIRDSNGSHVVHSILDSFPPPMLYPIHCNAVHHCRSLGIDQHGLCVLKKCLSMCPLADFIVFSRRFILEYTLEFVNNQYGNYLIQHVLERVNAGQMGPQQPQQITTSTPQSPHPRIADADDPNRHQLPAINELLYSKLRGHFARLSRQKFSSNVVEKCLKIPSPPLRAAIVSELIEADSVASMLLCSYGNYVLQNVLYVASQEECAILFSRVRPEHVLSSLRKNIRQKWERLLANAHLIHPGLVVTHAEGGEPQQVMQVQQGQQNGQQQQAPGSPGSQALNGSGHPMYTIRGITPGSVPEASTSPLANLYPSPQAIQLITSILGASTPGSTANIAYEAAAAAAAANGGNNPAGQNGAQGQMSPSMRGVNSVNARGSYVPSSRGGNVMQQGGQVRRGPLSNSGSTVPSPYLAASASPSPSFAPRTPLMASGSSSYSAGPSTAVSPLHSYQQQPQQQAPQHYTSYQPSPASSYSSPSLQPEYSPQPQMQQYRSGSSTPSYAPPGSSGRGHPQPPLHLRAPATSAQSQVHSPSSASSPAPQQQASPAPLPQSIAEQIAQHQAQLQQLLQLQAQQQQIMQQQHHEQHQ